MMHDTGKTRSCESLLHHGNLCEFSECVWVAVVTAPAVQALNICSEVTLGQTADLSDVWQDFKDDNIKKEEIEQTLGLLEKLPSKKLILLSKSEIKNGSKTNEGELFFTFNFNFMNMRKSLSAQKEKYILTR